MVFFFPYLDSVSELISEMFIKSWVPPQSSACLLCLLGTGSVYERTTVHSATAPTGLKVGWMVRYNRQGSVIHQFITRTEQNTTQHNISASDGINPSILHLLIHWEAEQSSAQLLQAEQSCQEHPLCLIKQPQTLDCLLWVWSLVTI